MAGDPGVDGTLDDFLKRTAIEETGSVPDGGESEAPEAQRSSESIVLKILLPEKETGHVIGKGGSVLNKIKETSGTRIRISAMDEVIPMTRERICTIVGTLPSVLLAQKLISTALIENAKPLMDEPAGSQRTLKLLLSHAAVGCVIGRGASAMPVSTHAGPHALRSPARSCACSPPRVVAPGGSLIKEMMLQTGAVIKASQPSELIQVSTAPRARSSGKDTPQNTHTHVPPMPTRMHAPEAPAGKKRHASVVPSARCGRQTRRKSLLGT